MPKSVSVSVPREARELAQSRALAAGGDAMIEVAIALLILHRTHSPAALGLVLSMPWWAGIISNLTSTAWIDRVSRRLILVWGDILRAILVIAIAVIPSLIGDTVAYFLLFGVAALYNTSFQAMTPVLSGDKLKTMIALIQQWESLAAAAAYLMVSVGFVRPSTIPWIFSVAAILFVLSALRIGTIKAAVNAWHPQGDFPTAPTSTRKQYSEGFAAFRKNPTLSWLTVISFFGAVLVFGFNVITAPAMRRVWHQPTAHYGWALLAIAIGQWVGGKLLSTEMVQKMTSKMRVVIGFSGLSLGFLALGIWHEILVALLILAVGGIANALASRAISQWIQTHTPKNILGRIMSLRGLFLISGAGIGSLAAGVVVTRFGVITTFYSWGVLGILIVLAVGAIPLLQPQESSSEPQQK